MKKYLGVSLVASLALTVASAQDAPSNWSGELRGGYQYGKTISSADQIGASATLKYESNSWNNLSFGVRASAVVGNGKEGEMDFLRTPFFDSSNDNYGIVNELYLNGNFGNNELSIGRVELDLPFVDSDDDFWGLIPNRYEAALLTNNHLEDTILTLAFIRSWSGVDAPMPERFNKINGNEGMYIVGIEYGGIENVTLKGFGYMAKDYLDMGYLEATYENESDFFAYSSTVQFALQKYDDNTEAKVWGIGGDVAHKGTHIGLSFGYNYNSDNGIATVLYGGGPLVSSTEHYVVDNLQGKGSLTRIGAFWDATSLMDGLSLEANYLDVNRDSLSDANGVDYKMGYELGKNTNLKIVYSDFKDKQDGDMKNLRGYLTYKF